MTLRRGFTFEPGSRVLIVEDVVTTGGSVREAMSVVQELGGQVAGGITGGSEWRRSGFWSQNRSGPDHDHLL